MWYQIRKAISWGLISSGSNLSDRLEDKLTGDVFGALRYLPFSSGLKPVLQGVTWEVGENVGAQLEAEFQKGEEVSEEAEEEMTKATLNQLEYQAKVLKDTNSKKRKYLVFLAKQSEAASIVQQTLERKLYQNKFP
jgi:hypothetical protein